jgi:hypothetical protein
MITVRAQEDSRIREELKTSRISKEIFSREKEVATITMATSMLWLVEDSQRKECLDVSSVVGDVAT